MNCYYRVKSPQFIGNYKNISCYCKRGDVFYADLGYRESSEQSGKRPVLVLQNNSGNKHSPTVIVAPMTSQTHKSKLPTHVKIYKNNYPLLKKDSLILLEQIVTIDKCRLRDKVCHLNISDLNDVDMAIRVSLDVK